MNMGASELFSKLLKIASGNPSAALNFVLFPAVCAVILSFLFPYLGSIKFVLWPIAHSTIPFLALPSFTSICLLGICAIYAFYELHWKRRLLPPGPMPWLIAGNMPQVLLHGASNIDALLQQWRAHYGGIFTFWMGPIPMVMVSDVELLRRYFVRHGDVFSGRWQNFITHTFMDGHNGIIQIEGEKWREQRRFSLHVLRDFGLGRTQMEEKIKVEVKALVAYLDTEIDGQNSLKTGPIDICKPVGVCIGNIVNSILFGRRYAHDDAAFIRVQQMLDRQSSLVIQPVMGLYLSLPITTKVPLLDRAWRELLSIRNDFWAFLDLHVQEHRRQFQAELEPSDFTDAYLSEMHRRGEANLGHFSEKQLKMLLLDLFFAGSETTVTTTKWGILLLILHPDVQERCYRELLDRTGLNRELELKDRTKLPYLSATICEIQRHANILPINLLRTSLSRVQVDGFTFPAGTMVLPQISITLNDPNYFPEPEKFRPERFLDETSGNLRRIDAFMPFSLGKHQCLGESLARAELFFIFAHLLGHFQFLPESTSEELPSTKRIYGLTVSPQPFKCRLARRRHPPSRGRGNA